MNDQLSRALSGAGVPIRELGTRLADFDPTRSGPGGQPALEWASANVSEPHSGLLAGMVGTGKTMLVCGLLAARADAWLERYPDVEMMVDHVSRSPDGLRETHEQRAFIRPPFADLFIGVPEMLDQVRRWIARPEGPDPLDAYTHSRGLVILDDLGREKVTDWATERLYVLVNSRYGELLPTIATSNLRPNELKGNGYEPIVRRLLDGRPAIWLSHGKAAI